MTTKCVSTVTTVTVPATLQSTDFLPFLHVALSNTGQRSPTSRSELNEPRFTHAREWGSVLWVRQAQDGKYLNSELTCSHVETEAGLETHKKITTGRAKIDACC